jgi:hypothetical protein
MKNDQIRGGFNGSLRSQMSPQLQRQIAQQEQIEAREAAQEERARTERAEVLQENAIRAAISQAVEQGQDFHPRMLRGERLGRTRQEAIAYFSGLQDMEDRKVELAERREFEQWQIRRAESLSGDTSVATLEAERAEEEWWQDQRRRTEVQRGRAIQRERIVQDARKAASTDTARTIHAVERARSRY